MKLDLNRSDINISVIKYAFIFETSVTIPFMSQIRKKVWARLIELTSTGDYGAAADELDLILRMSRRQKCQRQHWNIKTKLKYVMYDGYIMNGASHIRAARMTSYGYQCVCMQERVPHIK